MTFSGNIPICKRHRWRGLYSGLGAFILLDGLFGIGTELFKRFREKVMRVSARSTACSSAGHASPSNSSSVAILPLQGDSQHNETTGAWQDDPEIHRTKGWSWLSSKPAAKTKIFRMCIDPMRQYQISKDKLASLNTNKHYEIQDVLALRGNPKGLVDAIPFFAVVSGKLEDDAISRIVMLLDFPDLWEDLMLQDEKTLEHLEFAYRVLIKHGARIQSKLRSLRNVQPMKTMRVDLDPDIEGQITTETCEHIHTAWSARHVSAHLGNVTDDEREKGFAKRVHLAIHGKFTIMSLESLHAQFRRMLKSRGVQTHALHFDELSSTWVIDRTRARDMRHSWRDTMEALGPAVAGRADDDDVDDAPVSVLHGGGGLWRAFIRDRTFGETYEAGQKPDFHALAQEYADISPEELDRLTPLSEAATKRHSKGLSSGSSSSSFGPTGREVQRALSKRKAEAVYERMSEEMKDALVCGSDSVSPVEEAMKAAKSVRLGGEHDFNLALREGRSVLRAISMAKSKRLKELETIVQTWCSENQHKLLGELVGIVPHLVSLKDNLAARPPKQGFNIYAYRPNVSNLATVTSEIYVHGNHLNLSSVMQARFHRRCAPILHDKCQQFSAGSRKPVHACHQFGMVLCKGAGLQMWSFVILCSLP